MLAQADSIFISLISFSQLVAEPNDYFSNFR